MIQKGNGTPAISVWQPTDLFFEHEFSVPNLEWCPAAEKPISSVKMKIPPTARVDSGQYILLAKIQAMLLVPLRNAATGRICSIQDHPYENPSLSHPPVRNRPG
jgi:hypothetical protein